MSLDRLALRRAAPAEPSPTKKSDDPHSDLTRRGALAFVRYTTASWRGFRVLERSLLEGALALIRQGHGQTLFVALHGPRSFADRRLDAIEIKAINPDRPFGVMRDLLRSALARPEARSAVPTLPADLQAFLKNPTQPAEIDRARWPKAIAEFFAALRPRAPLLIVVDNAHLADAESFGMLEALARRVATSRILLVFTYRLDSRSSPQLEALMRTLFEARLARALVISAPETNDARLLFQAAFGRSIRPESAAASIPNDAADLLTYGLIVIETCRRVGRWSDAKTLAERLITAGEENQAPYVACAAAIALGHVLADQGKWDESLDQLERIQSVVELLKEDDLIAWLYWGLARAQWGKSERRRAFQMLRLAQTVSARVSDAALNTSIALCGVEWLADNRRVRAARDWLDAIERSAEQEDSLNIDAASATASGIVALAENDAIAAAGFFRAALRQWIGLGSEYSAARARLRLASALLAREDSDSRREGREELIDAHAAFTRLGAASDVNVVEELGARHGVRPRARRAPSSGSASPGGITPREREVLELLVRGLTNRQIAATLSITEKTAEGHVSNILAKLGVTSRGQAAGYAIANGLLETVEA
ncbi:MAG TPA: LuxR C-terminal-related transcriptional regulator [Anaerolineae bacterium]|nr:LuxR C-terminal-related transcriptional regulator [Anaerolineae bacterium]